MAGLTPRDAKEPPEDPAKLLLSLDDRRHPVFRNGLPALLHGLPDDLVVVDLLQERRRHAHGHQRPEDQRRDPRRSPRDRLERLDRRKNAPKSREIADSRGAASGGGGMAPAASFTVGPRSSRRGAGARVRKALDLDSLPVEAVGDREVVRGERLAIDRQGLELGRPRPRRGPAGSASPRKDVVIPLSNFFFSASRFFSASSRPFCAATIERRAVSIARAAARTSTTTFCSVVVKVALSDSQRYFAAPRLRGRRD